MKNPFILCLILFLSKPSFAQVGIGTTTPHSMLDVRGSVAFGYRSFSSSIVIDANDNTLVFTGNSNATATLPDATGCAGRTYSIKNASTAGITPVLTVMPSSSQTIDGCSTGWLLDSPNEAITVISNGNGWMIASNNATDPAVSSWLTDGNALSNTKRLGTTNNFALPFITNGIERMRITENGKVGIGSANAATELHILSGISASGITNTYVKGLTISSNGTGGFAGPGFYFENTDNPVGKRLFKLNYTANAGPDAYVNFQAVSDNGASNINANILAVMHSGRVGVGTAVFNGANPEKFLVDAGSTPSFNLIGGRGSINNYLQLYIQNNSSGTAASSDIVATANNGNETTNFVNMGINSSGHASTDILGGANTAYVYATGNDFVIGNASANKQLIFFTGGTSASNEVMRLNSLGIQPGADNVYALGKNGARWSQVWAADGIMQTSDRRLKTDIEKLAYGLNEVMQMQPVSYSWKDRAGSKKIGLIAQDVRVLVPEVVGGDEKTESLGMNYAELVPVLINAIKELKLEVEALKKELAGRK